MKVLFQFLFPTGSKSRKRYQTELSDGFELIFPENDEEKTLLQYAEETEVYIGPKISKEFLEKAKKLKHIQIPWTGAESLDFELLKKYPQISISNSHSNSLAIAEHAVALLLSTAKNLINQNSQFRKGDWSFRYNNEDVQWVTGKTLGILGYGAIGKDIAKIMKNAFQMKVLAVKRSIIDEDDPNVDFLGTMKDLKKVLTESDYLLVTLPITVETRGIIGKEEFELMKESAILVNISRGAVIEEKALYETLRNKRITGVGNDVWYNYPEDRNNPVNVEQNFPFNELDNIICTPHSAFKVTDREKHFLDDIVENIKLVKEGKKPKNLLNLDLGY